MVIETYRTTGTEYVLFQEFLKQVCKEKWGADEEKWHQVHEIKKKLDNFKD